MPSHYRNGNGGNNVTQTNLLTRAGQFINRTTGQPVPANMPYHVHQGQAMAGATHAQHRGADHDFYDTPTRTNVTNNRFRAGNTRSGMTTSRRAVSSGMSGYRRGGRTRRRMQQGGHTHGQSPNIHSHHWNMNHTHGGGPGATWNTPPGGGGVYLGSSVQGAGQSFWPDAASQAIGAMETHGPAGGTQTAGTHTHRQGITPRGRMRRGGNIRKMHQGGPLAPSPEGGGAYVPMMNVLTSHGMTTNFNNQNYAFLSSSNIPPTVQSQVVHGMLHASASVHHGDMNFDTVRDITDLVTLIDQILGNTALSTGTSNQLRSVRQQLQTNPTPQVVRRARQMVNGTNGSTSMRMNRRNTRSYRRGGNIRRFGHGGSHSRNNGCGPGMMYQNGGCVPASGGSYQRGGSTRKMSRGGVYSMNSDHARKMRKR